MGVKPQIEPSLVHDRLPGALKQTLLPKQHREELVVPPRVGPFQTGTLVAYETSRRGGRACGILPAQLGENAATNGCHLARHQYGPIDIIGKVQGQPLRFRVQRLRNAVTHNTSIAAMPRKMQRVASPLINVALSTDMRWPPVIAT